MLGNKNNSCPGKRVPPSGMKAEIKGVSLYHDRKGWELGTWPPARRTLRGLRSLASILFFFIILVGFPLEGQSGMRRSWGSRVPNLKARFWQGSGTGCRPEAERPGWFLAISPINPDLECTNQAFSGLELLTFGLDNSLLGWGGGRPVHCRIFKSVLGLCPLDVRCIYFPGCDSQKFP